MIFPFRMIGKERKGGKRPPANIMWGEGDCKKCFRPCEAREVFEGLLNASESKLSSIQLKKKFFIDEGLAQFVASPLCQEFILSIPYIDKITDEESYNKAMKKVIARERIQVEDSNKTPDLRKTFFVNCGDEEKTDRYQIDFYEDNIQYKVAVKRRNKDNSEYTEIRSYDKKTGLEVKRHKEAYRNNIFGYDEEQIEYTISREGITGNDIGIARINNLITRQSHSQQYLDLTDMYSDIGTLDIFGNSNIFDISSGNSGDFYRGQIYGSMKAKSQIVEDTGYESRLSKKIAESKGKYYNIETNRDKVN